MGFRMKRHGKTINDKRQKERLCKFSSQSDEVSPEPNHHGAFLDNRRQMAMKQ